LPLQTTVSLRVPKIDSGGFSDAEMLIRSGRRFAQLSTKVSPLLTKAKHGL